MNKEEEEAMKLKMLFEEDRCIEDHIISSIVPTLKKTEEQMAHFPSGLMACIRSRYYGWMSREELEDEFGDILHSTEDTIDDAWLRLQSIFKLGNYVEEELGFWLSTSGLLPSPDRLQYRIRSREHLISGNIDFMIFWDGK